MGKIIAFDLDDTLCYRPADVEHLGVDKYYHCKPIKEMIDLCNEMYDKGNTIVIYTARGMKTLDGKTDDIYGILYPITIQSLQEWGVKYHRLVMGKLHYDMLVDDKCMDLETAKKKLRNL